MFHVKHYLAQIERTITFLVHQDPDTSVPATASAKNSGRECSPCLYKVRLAREKA